MGSAMTVSAMEEFNDCWQKLKLKSLKKPSTSKYHVECSLVIQYDEVRNHYFNTLRSFNFGRITTV